MHTLSDEQLMLAYADGDIGAFERLYDRHRVPLFRYIIRQVGDRAIADDLYQGCWEKIIRARRQFRATASYRAWMYTLARNHLIDHFRRKRVTVAASDEFPAADNPGPESECREARRRADLKTAIEGLPAEQREALLLKLEAGLDLQAIADVTGVGRETAKSRLRYAISKLKKTLAD